MILRRPYAFLIKHFRIINFILALISCFFAYKTYGIINFFIKYVSNNYTSSLYPGFYSEYITLLLYVTLIIICAVLISLCLLFLYKKKSNKVYVSALVYYLLFFILFSVVKNLMITMETNIIASETARIYRDLSIILFIPQAIYIIYFFLYSFGLNFNNFNFQQDLKALEVSEEDSEEVEITFKKDNVKLERNIRRFFREFLYYIKENKFIFIIICVVVIGLIIYFVFHSLPEVVDSKFIQNEEFVLKNLTYRVEDSIITNLNYKGEVINKDKYYLVIRLYVKNDTNNDLNLLQNNFRLEVNKNNYYPTTDQGDNFIDYARNYFGNKIKANSENIYSLVYEITSSEIKKTYRLKINNGSAMDKDVAVAKYNYITITPIIVDKITSEGEYNVNDEITFSNSNLGNSKFKVTDYEITNSYMYKYTSCIRDVCNEYNKMVSVNYQTEDKTLIVLGYNYEIDNKVPYFNYSSDVYTFASTFLKVRYLKNGEYIYSNVKNVTPNGYKDKIILEVINKINTAENIWLSINIRNKEYLIKLK